jgi:hypothetical protein
MVACKLSATIIAVASVYRAADSAMRESSG